MSDKLVGALDGALNMVDRSRRRAASATGESTMAKFDRLEQELEYARQALESGRLDALQPLTEIVRWTADWIPDTDDPLLDALENVQRHARAILR